MVALLLDRPFVALLKREVVSQLRTVRAFLLLCLTMAALIYVTGQQMRFLIPGMGGGRFAFGLFQIFQQALMWVAVLFVPLFAATSISVERQKETLEQLLLTTLRPSEIVLGKALSAFSFYFFILVALFPIAGVIFFYVGIEWSEFLRMIGLASLIALMSAMVGVACSARFTRSLTAVIVSVMMVGFFTGLMTIYTSVSPRFGAPQSSFWVYALWPAVPALLAFLTARRRVFRACRTSRLMQILETPIGQSSPVLTESSFHRPAGAGRRKFTFSRTLVYLLSLPCIFLFGLVAYNMDMREVWKAWLVFQGVLLMFLSTSAVATQLTKEYEQNTIDLLRMTLLSPFGVVAGKLASGIFSLAPFYGGVLCSGAILLIRAPNFTDIGAILSAHFLLLSFALMSMCAVQFVSLLTRRSSIALVLGYGVNLGTLFLIGRFAYSFRHGEFLSLTMVGGVLSLVVAAVLLSCSVVRYAGAHSRAASWMRRLQHGRWNKNGGDTIV